MVVSSGSPASAIQHRYQGREIGRRRRLERQNLAGPRMMETQPGGVQCLAGKIEQS
jgi:hypothetical protein